MDQQEIAPSRVRGGYVRVPLAAAAALAGQVTALTVLAVLYDLQSGTSGVVTADQDRLMERLGRRGRAPHAVRRAVDQLRDAGLVRAERLDRGRGRYRYVLTMLAGQGQRWAEVPRPVLDAIAEGLLPPATLAVWLDLDRALGRHGRTSDTDDQIGERIGRSGHTVARYVRLLARLGYVRSRTRADGGRMLHRVDLLSAGPVPHDARALTRGPASKNGGSARAKMMGPWAPSLAPEKDLAPENPSSSGLPDDRHLGDASASDDAHAKKGDDPQTEPSSTPRRPQSGAQRSSEHGVASGPGEAPRRLSGPARAAERVVGGGATRDERVRYVLAGIDPYYRTGAHRRWTRGVARAVLAALEGTSSRPALTPQACRWALAHLFDPEAHGERTVPAARAALALLAAETRNGLACRDCGRDDEPIEGRLCPPCTPEHTSPEHPTEADLPPLPERLAAYRALGVPADTLNHSDPTAAVALRRAYASD